MSPVDPAKLLEPMVGEPVFRPGPSPFQHIAELTEAVARASSNSSLDVLADAAIAAGMRKGLTESEAMTAVRTGMARALEVTQ